MTALVDEDDDHHEQPKQPHLAKQDASTVDPAKLTALTPEVVRTLPKTMGPDEMLLWLV